MADKVIADVKFNVDDKVNFNADATDKTIVPIIIEVNK